jgi:ADP-ribosylglycohydrolase
MDQKSSNIIRKAQGSMIGLLVGDALGASVEGFTSLEIARVAADHGCAGPFLDKYIPAIQMGSVTPLRTEIGYRWASEASDEQFVSPGPTTRPALQPFLRCGHYSDDGNTSLALGESLLRCRRLDGADCAKSFAEAWKQGGGDHTTRGYPPTAKRVMQAILDGTSHQVTGLPPHFPFPKGSFANGGAMRISPLAIAYRHCTDRAVFRLAVSEAIKSSHVHPEAVDGAVVQAETVRSCLMHGLVFLDDDDEDAEKKSSSSSGHIGDGYGGGGVVGGGGSGRGSGEGDVNGSGGGGTSAAAAAAASAAASSVPSPPLPPSLSSFDWDEHLGKLIGLCETDAMRERLTCLRDELRTVGPVSPSPSSSSSTSSFSSSSTSSPPTETPIDEDQDTALLFDADFKTDLLSLAKLVPTTRPGSGLGFQIAAIDALPCSLWFLCRYANSRPAECLPRAIGLGGDTDTVASMCGAALGALHGGSSSRNSGGGEENSGGESSKGGGTGEGSGGEGGQGKGKQETALDDPSKLQKQEGQWWWVGKGLVGGLENDHPRGRDHALRVAAALATELDLREVGGGS